MRTVPIEEISFDPTLGLMLKPATGVNYEHIYRAANGLRWNREHSAIVAYEPNRWESVALLRHMLATIKSECGELLVLNAATHWNNVESSLVAQLTATLERSKQ